MFAALSHNTMGQRLFAFAAVLALALRIAIPAGFMPAATSQGMVVAICTGQGTQQLTIDLGKHAPDRGSKAANEHCLFSASAGHLLFPAMSVAIASPAPIVAVATSAAIADLTVHRLAAPPPPSHAPPSRA